LGLSFEIGFRMNQNYYRNMAPGFNEHMEPNSFSFTKDVVFLPFEELFNIHMSDHIFYEDNNVFLITVWFERVLE